MTISLEKTKEILKVTGVPDDEAEVIRDSFRNLAEIIFEKWQVDKKLLVNQEKNYERFR